MQRRRRPLAALTQLVPLLACGALAGPSEDGAWPTKAHDSRRTAQASVTGPAQPLYVARRRVPFGHYINMAATLGSSGNAYFGTWGVVRDFGTQDRSQWDKFDGQLFAWRAQFGPAPGFSELFGPGLLDLVPFCHDYLPSAPPQPSCPQPPGSELSWWNGTVEGTAVLSPDEQRIYAGRGDGKVYALDARSGGRIWTFRTCNDAADCDLPTTNPEAGGEVISGLLLRGADELYVATYGLAEAAYPETSAVYRLDAGSGALVWRYPASGSAIGSFLAAPALSPDGSTIYAASFCQPFPCQQPSRLYAFAPDGQLRWPAVELRGSGNESLGAWTMAVGSDGTIYLGGGSDNTCQGAFVSAHQPADGSLRWGPIFLPAAPGSAPCANIAGGLALREVAGQTTRLYATTNFIAEFSILGRPDGGRLFALDPATGAQSWGQPFFEPRDSGGFGNAIYPSIDATGTVYTGSSGAYQTGLQLVAYQVEQPGRIFAVSEAGELLWQLAAGGAMAYAHPVLGPGGVLYFGDTRDRLVGSPPISDPRLVGLDLDPELYAVWDRVLPQPLGVSGVWLAMGAAAGLAGLGFGRRRLPRAVRRSDARLALPSSSTVTPVRTEPEPRSASRPARGTLIRSWAEPSRRRRPAGSPP
jgi:outer membrane protein assembly factor BamB